MASTRIENEIVNGSGALPYPEPPTEFEDCGCSTDAPRDPNCNPCNVEMGVVSGSTDNYNNLYNKPTINGLTLEGNLTTSDLRIDGSDKFYTFNQSVPSDRWTINHNMDKYPAVSVVDSGNNIVIGDVRYIDKNNLIVVFTGAFSGSAYLN